MTIGTLGKGGVLLVGNHLNAFERAVVLVVAMMLALVNCAFNAHICVVFHKTILSYIYS